MFNLKIFFNKYLRVIKKGELISLFIFSFIYPQLSLENIIHLNSPDIYNGSNQSDVIFYNNTDILYITEDDSSKIYKTESMIESNYKINNLFIKSQLSSYYSIFKTTDEIFLFKMQKKYKSINSNISFSYNDNLTPSLFFQLDDNDNLSYGVGVKILKDKLNVLAEYKLFKYLYDLYFNYDEFIFYQTFLRNEENYNIEIVYDKPIILDFFCFQNKDILQEVNHLFKFNYKDYYIPRITINDILQSLDNDSYEKYNVGIESVFNFRNNRKINLSYEAYESKQTITLLIPALSSGSNHKILDIRNLEINDNKIKIAYLFKINKSQYNIGFLTKKNNFECTSRIRPSLISNDLEVSLGAPVINNYDVGKIVSEGFFLIYNKILNNNLNFTFNTMYLKDSYDIVIKNDLINGLSIVDVRFETFELKSKDAIELGFILDYSLKKINLIFSFDQHIPIKFEKFNNQENDSIGDDSEPYGGGKFQIMISKKL